MGGLRNQFKKINLIKDTTPGGLYTLFSEKSVVLPAMIIVHLGRYSDEKSVIKEGWARLMKGGIMVFGSLNRDATPQCTTAFLDAKISNSSELKRFPFSTQCSWIKKIEW